MPGLVRLLRCVGRAAVKGGGKALAGLVPFGGAAFEIAEEAVEQLRREHGEDRLRAELCRLARGTEPAGAPHVSVRGPQGPYALGGLLAAGDVADVHLAEAGGRPYLLKVSRSPGGDDFLDRERAVLGRLLAAAGDTTYRGYLPALAESFLAEGGRRVNVFGRQPGLFTLEQVHERHPALGGTHLAWVFKRLLTVLGFCHRQGAVHAAVLPCHVLLEPAGHGLVLAGWGQSVAAGRPVADALTRYLGWYPPEVLNRQPATGAADLFGAARCLVYLAGGDPASGRMPDAVPAALRRFVGGCLLASPRMRPGDAWELMEEFDDLLSQLYGAPKFHPLTMT